VILFNSLVTLLLQMYVVNPVPASKVTIPQPVNPDIEVIVVDALNGME
jgi:hypothetical protein